MNYDDKCPECNKRIKAGQRIIVLAPEGIDDELEETIVHRACFDRSYEKVADLLPN